jgi:hypothetical protein
MLQTLLKMAAAIAGMFVVLGIWAYIQDVVRRRSGCRNPNKDVLDFMLHGCGGGCHSEGSCHSEIDTDSKLRVYEAHHETL